jgi:hypothetical protein
MIAGEKQEKVKLIEPRLGQKATVRAVTGCCAWISRDSGNITWCVTRVGRYLLRHTGLAGVRGTSTCRQSML